MNVDNLNFFPILVTKVSEFLTKDECELILQNTDRSLFSNHDALVGDAYSTYLTCIENNCNAINDIEKFLPNLYDRLITVINQYTTKLGVEPVKLDNAWMNIQSIGSTLVKHIHPMSVISGALYLKVDENSSGILFENPNPYKNFLQVKAWNYYNYKTVWIQPKIGDLVLFPSWLEHGSYGTNNSQERIVLSFNTNSRI